jgi:hypothetical protein
MNANDSRPERTVADLARLLRVPAERDLPAGRRHLIKEHLMTELRTGQPAKRPAARTRRPRRTALTAAGVGLLAGAAAVASVIGLTGHSGSHPGISGHATAAKLLSQIAAAAAKAPVREVTDNQFEYIASEISGGRPYGKPAPDKPHMRKVWIPVTDLCRTTLITENGKKLHMSDKPSPDQRANGAVVKCPYKGTVNEPTYRLLQSLPTDPHALLNLIYKATKGAGQTRDQEAFTTIGDLLRESIAPPDVSAALFRAAALIPGVSVIHHGADAIGRRGVAVSFTLNGNRSEWIFDKHTLQMLGELNFYKGTLTFKSAIVTRAFVDHLGEVPPPN